LAEPPTARQNWTGAASPGSALSELGGDDATPKKAFMDMAMCVDARTVVCLEVRGAM
jgi:hypothetical protein